MTPKPSSAEHEMGGAALQIDDVPPYSELAGVYDEIVIDPCHGQWAAYLDQLWGSDKPGVRNVLDVCCGTGLMAAELIALGYQTVGVDSSPAMLARARNLLGPDVRLLQQTLPKLVIDDRFDAAISTFDGLNYLNETDFASTLLAVGKSLRSGGWFVFDLHTDAMMHFTVSNPVVKGKSDGNVFYIRSDVDVRARTCDTQIQLTVRRSGATFREQHRQYFHHDDDVQVALARAGFGNVKVTDEYTNESTDSTTLRATWSARRLAI